MGKQSRDKGANFERLICRMARAAGLTAERTAPLQAGYSGHGDVLIAGRRVECKHRDYIPQWRSIRACEPFYPRTVLRGWLVNGVCVVRKTGCAAYAVELRGGLAIGIPLAIWLAGIDKPLSKC